MAIGTLRLPKREFLEMRFVEVLYRLNGVTQQRIYDLNMTRIATFHQWRGQGVKVNNMPLKYLWQVFEIPQIDGDIRESIKFTTVRKMTVEEKKLIDKINGSK